MRGGGRQTAWRHCQRLAESIARTGAIVGASTLLATIQGCGSGAGGSGLSVVATTTLVGDVVRTVGGDHLSLTVLLPRGVDPHSFEPSPRDVASLSRARLVFVNGLGLESFLGPLLDNAVDPARIVVVSEGVVPSASEAQHGHEHAHRHDLDPHVWFVPDNVAIWARRIAGSLAEADPARATLYAARADSYAAALDSLDVWIQHQVDRIPPERRILLTDHATLGYFARRYGFRDAGSVLAGVSTLAEPSARDLAERIRLIRSLGVPALFVGMTSPTELADRVASDIGIRVLRLYTGSLSGLSGPAPDYVAFMRHNVHTIVTGLTGSKESTAG